MCANYYSIRMHAAAGGSHVSGAERIVSGKDIDSVVRTLINRAMRKGSAPDEITITIENLGSAQPRNLTSLDIVTVDTTDHVSSRSVASRALLYAGVSRPAVDEAMNYLSNGPAPGGINMRGAMLINAETGRRLEPDSTRGVRASRFDWSGAAGDRIRNLLGNNGLSHFRTYEALALATKIAHGPGVKAELCWSDDPDYTAGYVASLKTGYVRFPFLKKAGDGKGGRAVFLDSGIVDVQRLIHYLQTEAVLITDIGTQCNRFSPELFISHLES